MHMYTHVYTVPAKHEPNQLFPDHLHPGLKGTYTEGTVSRKLIQLLTLM